MRRFPDISTWNGRFAGLACIVILPFLRFLLQKRYGLFHPDVAVAVIILAVPCLAAALATRRRLAFYLLALLCILVVSATAFQRVMDRLLKLPIGPTLVFLTCLIAASMWLLKKNFFHIMLVFVLSSFAVDLVEFLLPRSSRPVLADSPEMKSAHLPHKLYIILDEHIGTGGIPEDVPEGRSARIRLEEMFARYNFHLYPFAFSNYAMTVESIPSILNRRLLEQRISGLNEPEGGARWGVYSFRQNLLFSECVDQGYAIHVYQYRSIDFCTIPETVQQKIEYSDDLEVFNHNRGPWYSHFQWIVGNYQRSDLLLSRFNGLFPFRFRARIVGPLGVSQVWPQMLARDIVAARRKTLFFAHLLVPHRPYLYHSDGEIRDFTEWSNDDLEPSFERETYLNRYRRYFDQLEHLRTELEWLLQFLKERDALDSLLIVVHGDHGSRIRWVQGKGAGGRQPKRFGMDSYDYYEDSPELQDLLNRFSTLLAVKFPQAQAPAIVPETGSVLRLLNRDLYRKERRSLPSGADSVYLFDEGDQPHEIHLAEEWAAQH